MPGQSRPDGCLSTYNFVRVSAFGSTQQVNLGAADPVRRPAERAGLELGRFALSAQAASCRSRINVPAVAGDRFGYRGRGCAEVPKRFAHSHVRG
jgi:hypothetical protein